MCRIRQPETKQNLPKKGEPGTPEEPQEHFWRRIGEVVEVIHIDNTQKSANKPFALKWTFNRRPFHALIYSDSPVTIYSKAYIQKMFGKDYKLRPLEKNEKYIDFSGNEIEFLGAIIGQVESGARKLDKVRPLIVENGSRTVVRSRLAERFGDHAKDRQ